jgi:PRTRC genetic system protein B
MLSLTTQSNQSTAALVGAVLLYGHNNRAVSSSTEPAIATVHSVEYDGGGRPLIMPGRLITEADLVTIAKGCAHARGSLQTEWLDTRVLARGPDRMIWWSAPCKRAMFFAKSTYNGKTFDGSASCPVPGLVWMARPGDGLYVYACKGAERPTMQTQLYQAPLFNIWGRGKVCVGSAALPDEKSTGDPGEWEKVVFGSRFTHPNFTEPDRLVFGECPAKFWQKMVVRPRATFPEEKLVEVPLRVEQLLERDVVDTLNKWPRPQGEF